jgi:hypothetical protein
MDAGTDPVCLGDAAIALACQRTPSCEASPVVAPEIIERLRWHAGLHGDPLDPQSVSGSLATGRGVASAVADFLSCVTRLNRAMNGPVPSEVVEPGDESVPRDVAYAVSEVARQLGDTAHVFEAWEVDVAWNAVRARDIDDLAEHIAHERQTNPPGPNKPSA